MCTRDLHARCWKHECVTSYRRSRTTIAWVNDGTVIAIRVSAETAAARIKADSKTTRLKR